ncbi:MAG: hypothetical protein ACLFVJ_14665 [Persicimonas sp.]
MQRIHLILAAFAASAALLLGGCEVERQSYELQPTSVSPSVTGELYVEPYNDTNYQLDMELQYLALPQNLGEDLSTYAVWINPRNTDQQLKMGHLNVNREERTGTMRFTTPYEEFTVLVTAEANSAADRPSDTVVVRQPVRVE